MPAARRPSAWAPATWRASSTRRPTCAARRRAHRCARRPSTTPPAARRRTAWCCVDAVRAADARGAARARRRCCSTRRRRRTLQALMWPDGKLSPAVIGQSADAIAQRAGARRAAPRRAAARILLVDEDGVGAGASVLGREAQPGAGALRGARLRRCARRSSSASTPTRAPATRSGLHSARPERALQLGLALPVSRVIVDQAHCIATGGSFDNGLPFSLSMGCGTWGTQQLLRQHELPALPEHHARLAADCRGGARAKSEIFGAFFASTAQHERCPAPFAS